MIKEDIASISVIRKRSLDVATLYEHDQSCWVVRCVLVLQDSGQSALRLSVDQFRIAADDDSHKNAMVGAIMIEIDTVII